MTYKKAIEWLEAMKNGVFPFPADNHKIRNEVFDTAIKALEEAEERSHYTSELDRIVEQKKESDRKWKETQELFKKHEDCLNHLDCSTCDRFGIDCGTCEVSEDD